MDSESQVMDSIVSDNNLEENFDAETPDLNFDDVTEEGTEELEETENENENQKKTSDETESGGTSKTNNDNRLTRLPISRIKTIMKADSEVQLINSEAAFAVTKATELFIESLAREAFLYTTKSKKKTVQKRDIDLAISNVDALMFLEGTMDF